MDEKNKSKTPLEELKKLANDFRDVVTELGDILAKILPDIEIPEEEEEDTWKMKCPYEEDEEVWIIDEFGEIDFFKWGGFAWKNDCLRQGNTFPTKEAAELEAKRRNLLTRFRAFRDECNGDWKPNWNNPYQEKYIIKRQDETNFYAQLYYTVNEFNLFGYFKNEKDAERAIDLFGDEIKELFVEGEE